MMENHDTYLAAWFEGKMTDGELQELISAEAFAHYLKIKNTLSGMELQTPGTEGHFERIKDRLAAQPVARPRVMKLRHYFAAAASVLLFVCIGLYAFRNNTVVTGFGQQQRITLADHSEVHLAAKSSLVYANIFKFSRNLSLQGEAYFEVAKGSKFTVNTPQGTVTVLGTKFNVVASGRYFEVHCDEGRVRVASKAGTVILTPGKSVSFYENGIREWQQEIRPHSHQSQTESAFYSTPAEVVFQKIENQFGVSITYPDAVRSKGFTGAVSHTDLNKAMQSVCLPLGLTYTLSGRNKIEVTDE
ncbi:hypothetical protein HYN48_06805 [Flavobacterium magnum]|uniref:Uncharacterized protein n=1 Tax=Flavobacterium magnum TaxID=2162713 RepID=A0A2S0REZ8_9FLAO|nr:FecR family protein [Flavobacterium magnum]AWA29808.1 hypothetical protein HYN48_06805 [Flavobacterium magnum]